MIPAAPFDLDDLLPPGRLTILTGGKGCGKTQLALELADRVLGDAKPGCAMVFFTGDDSVGHLAGIAAARGIALHRVAVATSKDATGTARWRLGALRMMLRFHSPILVVDDLVLRSPQEVQRVASLAADTQSRVLGVVPLKEAIRGEAPELMGSPSLQAAAAQVLRVASTTTEPAPWPSQPYFLVRHKGNRGPLTPVALELTE